VRLQALGGGRVWRPSPAPLPRDSCRKAPPLLLYFGGPAETGRLRLHFYLPPLQNLPTQVPHALGLHHYHLPNPHFTDFPPFLTPAKHTTAWKNTCTPAPHCYHFWEATLFDCTTSHTPACLRETPGGHHYTHLLPFYTCSPPPHHHHHHYLLHHTATLPSIFAEATHTYLLHVGCTSATFLDWWEGVWRTYLTAGDTTTDRLQSFQEERAHLPATCLPHHRTWEPLPHTCTHYHTIPHCLYYTMHISSWYRAERRPTPTTCHTCFCGGWEMIGLALHLPPNTTVHSFYIGILKKCSPSLPGGTALHTPLLPPTTTGGHVSLPGEEWELPAAQNYAYLQNQ
jgi:hypothetical protein